MQDIVTLPDDSELALISKPLWWQRRGLSYTASGYGAKIPTSYIVHYRGRTHRVYCTIYSNVGTCWIVVNRQRVIVH
jgi:hypothetical protein